MSKRGTSGTYPGQLVILEEVYETSVDTDGSASEELWLALEITLAVNMMVSVT